MCLDPAARQTQVLDIAFCGCCKAWSGRVRGKVWGGGGKEEKEICSGAFPIPASSAAAHVFSLPPVLPPSRQMGRLGSVWCLKQEKYL